jgi:hypothetical protein
MDYPLRAFPDSGHLISQRVAAAGEVGRYVRGRLAAQVEHRTRPKCPSALTPDPQATSRPVAPAHRNVTSPLDHELGGPRRRLRRSSSIGGRPGRFG